MKLKNKYDVYLDSLSNIHESVFKIGDNYKVKTTIDIPKSLINSFVSRAKKTLSIDPRENWSDTDLAEMFVTYITTHFMNIESLPTDAILGEPDKTKEEVSTSVETVDDNDNKTIEAESDEETTDTKPADNEEVEGHVEEGLKSFFKGGTEEELKAKEEALTKELDDYIAKYPDLYFNGKEINKDNVLAIMKKNNFLGTFKLIDAKFTKHKHPSLSYKEGAKGLNKIAAGTSGNASN